MRARELMTSPVITVRPSTSAKEAASLLAEHGFTALPVLDEDDRLIGIVTEADLIRDRVPRDVRYRHHETPHPVPDLDVGSLMTSPAVAMGGGTDVADLCRALLDDRIRAMPIVDGATVVGIVTRRDVVRALARSDADIAADVRHHLEIYGGPGRWRVEVHDGVVHIVDAYDSETDRHVATLLAQAVPGVLDARTVSETTEGLV
ncbi:CBS domain-containing protein [Amycolatopsis sp. 195334CR]|uniref:CBS domain-containing protein n=1 Tax=Amycolatopsis sp. 195334CR TaxID=2814588 RepID=UPI001A8CE562|nr:CBS domain-containing protein [Amycolatopsis sp. 195334CR]MBN6040364.1 CBS domain-containing protein [Amycolatopsis sp. 195334CR]